MMTKRRAPKKMTLDRAIVLGSILVTMVGSQLLADQDFVANSRDMVIASQQLAPEDRRQTVSQQVDRTNSNNRPVTRTRSSR
jgi:uncharacterized membrane protein